MRISQLSATVHCRILQQLTNCKGNSNPKLNTSNAVGTDPNF